MKVRTSFAIACLFSPACLAAAGQRQPGLQPAEEHRESDSVQRHSELARRPGRRNRHLPSEGARSQGGAALGRCDSHRPRKIRPASALHQRRRRRVDPDGRPAQARHVHLQLRWSTACGWRTRTTPSPDSPPCRPTANWWCTAAGRLTTTPERARTALVTRHVYHSEVTNGERELYVYTPPGYDRSKRYPVLYLVGGSGDLPSNWVYDGRVEFHHGQPAGRGQGRPDGDRHPEQPGGPPERSANTPN